MLPQKRKYENCNCSSLSDNHAGFRDAVLQAQSSKASTARHDLVSPRCTTEGHRASLGGFGKGIPACVGALLAGGMFSPNTCHHHQLFQRIQRASSHRTMQYCEKPTACVYCPPPFTWTFDSTLEIIPRFIF